MTDTCGLTSCEPFARWDRDSQSWKTSEATSLWALTLSSLTLPQWGGLHDGELCEHPTPELHTSALDYSSLPTPNAADGKRNNLTHQRGEGNPTLLGAVHHLPTPTRADYRSVNSNPGVRNQGGGIMPASEHSLPAKIAGLLPTPTVDDASNITRASGCYNSLTRTATALLPTPAVNDMGEGKTLEWWDDWAPRQKAADGRPAPHGRSLAIEAQRLLPTPNCMDSMGTRSDEALARAKKNGGCANLKDVIPRMEWTGPTTRQPFTDGKPSQDDPHQHQLSLDDLAHPA